jgi:hypothetical protein
MKYVKRVKSTLKRGCDVPLTQRTLIVGRNHTGKSTIVQSIQLAACGFVQDVEERDTVARHTDIARLFPPDGPWEAEIELAEDDLQLFSAADTTVFSWSIERSGKSFKKPAPPAMALAFPVQTVLEKLRGSPETLRTWLESLASPQLTPEAMAELLPPAAREDAAAFAKRHRSTDLLALGKAASTEASALKSQAEAKESTVDTMMAGVPTPLLDDRRESLLEEQGQLVRELTSSGPQPGTISQAQYEIEMAKFGVMETAYAELTVELETLGDAAVSPETVELARKLDVLYQLFVTHAKEFGVESCMLCGKGTESDITVQAEEIIANRDALSMQRAVVARRKELEATGVALQAQYQEHQSRLGKLRIADPLSGSASEKRDRLNAIRAQVASDDAARLAWRNREASVIDIEQLRARSDNLNRLASTFKRVGTKQLKEAKADFEDRVSSFLPGATVCEVDLATGRIGFVEDGVLVTTLSGAKGMQLLAAVASYVAASSSTPCVITNPDRGWSGDTLEATMQALLDAPCQVILTATVEPDHPVPGWSVVRLDT